MDYTTKLGDKATEAHVNYQCPCGCVAGLIYERDQGSQHLGQCCCGRLLWVGDDAEAVVRSHYKDGANYKLDVGRVTLPWAEERQTALAEPLEALARERAKREAGQTPTKVTDPVCRMMIDPDEAAGFSDYKGVTYYFCAVSCKTRFEAEPERYVGVK
jgi:YHS domain-containing protein